MGGDREDGNHAAAVRSPRHLVPYAVALVAVVAVLAPMFRSPAPDSFPLSTYPMFAHDRGDHTWLDTVIGRDANGEPIRLSPGLISGSDEPVLASATVTRAIAADAASTLCTHVAERVREGGADDVVTVQVVSERHDLDRFTPDEPLERVVHVACEAGS